MSSISIGTLSELAALPEPEARVEKLFDWYFERHKLLIEVTAVSVGAFFAALIVAALKGDYANNWTVVAIVALGVVLLAGSLVGRSYLLMVKMEDDLVGALGLVTGP